MVHWLAKIVEIIKADTSDLKELAHLAGADPKTFYRGVDLEKLDLEGQNIEGMDFGDAEQMADVLRSQLDLDLFSYKPETPPHQATHFKRAKRQEERVVLLLAEFLRNRSHAMEIISDYKEDKADLANSAIDALIQIRDLERKGKTFTDLQIARRVSGRFSRSENKRPVLTYFLAKYLSYDAEIREWLTKKSVYSLSRSRQLEFKEFLDNPARRWDSSFTQDF